MARTGEEVEGKGTPEEEAIEAAGEGEEEDIEAEGEGEGEGEGVDIVVEEEVQEAGNVAGEEGEDSSERVQE